MQQAERRRPPRAARPVRASWWQPAALGGAWLAVLFVPLLSPARALANRDVLLFHLPLRVCFRNLVLAGHPPLWNPWLNGGQPLLSNPSYAAFYPPTWLVLPLPPVYALNVLALLHAAIAFAGAWRLARRLGAGRGAAALAAVGYSGSGALLSLLNAFTLFCSMAWFPWVLAFGDDALRRPPADVSRRSGSRSWLPGPRSWVRPALLAGLALGLQLLNGEPSTVMISSLGLLALAAAATTMPRRPAAGYRELLGVRVLVRALVPLVVGAALAAVQLLPTAGRLAGTVRSAGLPAAEATLWSSRPLRLVEIVFPHFFGDPSHQAAGLFFGRGLHDLDYPFLVSPYPGLLVALLGAAALALWPIPRRAAWVLCVTAGAFLALGHFNPLYEPLRRLLPPLAAQRYPERFAILAIAPLAFAAALGWQRLMDERRAGRRAAADLPLALGLVILATAALLTALLHLVPGAALQLVRDHGPVAVTAGGLARGLASLRREGWMAIATAAAAAGLLALCRWRRPRPAVLGALAVALLAGDLWFYGHALVRTVPAAEYREPPPLLHRLAAPGTRLFVQSLPEERQLPLARGDTDLALARALLSRLLPYSAALWNVPYALNEDYDRMLTRWGAATLQALHADLRQQPVMGLRLLGTWGVGGMLLRASTAAGLPEEPPAAPQPPGRGGAAGMAKVSGKSGAAAVSGMSGAAGSPVEVPRRAVQNGFRLPLYRFVPSVSFHSTYASALYVARSQGFAVDRREHCVRTGAPPATVDYPTAPRLLAWRGEPGSIELRYSAAAGGFFVAAETFDDGWQAVLDDDAPRRLYPTAAGQLGVELPPGEHRLRLAYRERLLPLGAAVSALTLAGCMLLLASGRDRPPA